MRTTTTMRSSAMARRRAKQQHRRHHRPKRPIIKMFLLLCALLFLATTTTTVFAASAIAVVVDGAKGSVRRDAGGGGEDAAAKMRRKNANDKIDEKENKRASKMKQKDDDKILTTIESDEKNEYERLKTRFIDAKNVPIWEEPTESSLMQKQSPKEEHRHSSRKASSSASSSLASSSFSGEAEQKFFIGNAMKMATKEKDVDAVISSYLTKKSVNDVGSRRSAPFSGRGEGGGGALEEEQRLGVPGLMETLIGERKETEIERKSRFPEHVFGATRNVEKNQKTRDGWELTFSDEFDLDYLDLEKWTPRNGAPTSRRGVGGVVGNAMSQLGSPKSHRSSNSGGGSSSGSSSSSSSSSGGGDGERNGNGQNSGSSTSSRGSFLGAQEEETVDKETWFHERNCKVVDGALVIASRKTVGKYDKPKSFDDDNDDNGVYLDIPGAQKFSESEFPFESCYIDSSKAFSQVYGRYEVRARLPGLSYDPNDKDTCAGVFPRIELLPDPDKTVPKDACWPRGGDIRVAQAYGQGRGGPGAKIGAIESGFHFMPSGATCGVDGYVVDRTRPFELMNQVEKSEYLATNFSSTSGTTSSRLGEEEKIKYNADWAREFHVFAVEWDKESLRFFIDDVFTHEVNAYSAPMIPRWPFFVGIGTSVSPYGVLEALKNCEQDDQFAIIDYVRVYSKKSPHEVINNEVYFFWLFAVIVLPTLATMYCSAKYLIRQVIREDLFGGDEKVSGNFGDGSSNAGNSLESGGSGDRNLGMGGKVKGVAFESLTDEKRRRRRLLRKLKHEMGVIDSIAVGTTEPLLTKILHEKEEIARARVERAFKNEDALNNAAIEGMEDESYRKYSKQPKTQKETKNVGGVTLRLPDITPKRAQSTYFSETSDFTTEAEGVGSGDAHHHHRSSGSRGMSSDSGSQIQYGSGEL